MKIRADNGRGPFVRRSETRPQPSTTTKKSAAAHDEFAIALALNESGAQRNVFDCMQIKGPLVDPTTDDDHERAFYSRIQFRVEDVDEDDTSNVCIMQAPAENERGAPALFTGITVARLTGSTGKDRATTKSGEVTLEAADDGPFEILHDPGPADEERFAYVRFGSSGAGSSTTLTDGCECSDTYTSQGTTLSGSPTICCTGHEALSVDMGDVLGTKTLYHLTGDIWSTYNDDSELDNPIVVECYPDQDEYDLILELSATGATLTTAARAPLNCDPICVEYELSGTYACQGSNKFRLGKHSGSQDLRLSRCVCVIPSLPPTCLTGWATLPSSFEVTIPSDLGEAGGNPCFNSALEEPYLLQYIGVHAVIIDSVSFDAHVWCDSITLAPNVSAIRAVMSAFVDADSTCHLELVFQSHAPISAPICNANNVPTVESDSQGQWIFKYSASTLPANNSDPFEMALVGSQGFPGCSNPLTLVNPITVNPNGGSPANSGHCDACEEIYAE